MKALIALALSAVADGLLLGSLSFGSARDVRLTARSQPPCRSHAYREVSRTPRGHVDAPRYDDHGMIHAFSKFEL